MGAEQAIIIKRKHLWRIFGIIDLLKVRILRHFFPLLQFIPYKNALMADIFSLFTETVYTIFPGKFVPPDNK